MCYASFPTLIILSGMSTSRFPWPTGSPKSLVEFYMEDSDFICTNIVGVTLVAAESYHSLHFWFPFISWYWKPPSASRWGSQNKRMICCTSTAFAHPNHFGIWNCYLPPVWKAPAYPSPIVSTVRPHTSSSPPPNRSYPPTPPNHSWCGRGCKLDRKCEEWC